MEVYPFYPKFERVEDYISALEYCMESELFAKQTYELLASMAKDEEVRKLALELAVMEQRHYDEIKKVYDLLRTFETGRLSPRELCSGAYILTDDAKAKYSLLDFLDEPREVPALIRENPQRFMEFFDDVKKVLWITRTDVENAIPPEAILDMRGELARFFRECLSEGKQGVVFIQNLGYLSSQLGFRDTLDFILYVKDLAIINNGYLIVTAVSEAFDRKEWAILTSELELIS